MTKGEETKQFIIEKAAPIFNIKGIAATAMSDIMEVTKLSKGSLYVHFENKELLAASAIDYNMDVLVKKVKSAIYSYTYPKDQLFAYLDVFANPNNPPVKGGCPMMNFGTEADDTNEAVRKKIAQFIGKSQETISHILEQGKKENVFLTKLNAKEFATVIFAMLEGGIMISRITGDNRNMQIIIRNIKKLIEEQMA